MTNIAMENGHRNSEFSHEKWQFSIAMLNYQRVWRILTRYGNLGDVALKMKNDEQIENLVISGFSKLQAAIKIMCVNLYNHQPAEI